MDFLISISEKINPLQSVMILSFAIFISSFFVMSERRAVKRFIVMLFSVSLILAFYLNIYSFVSAGNFSNVLLSFENLQMIEISIIIFCALNLIFFISTYCRDNRHFIKILSIFLFSTISAVFFVLARNFILMFVALVIFILVIFQLMTVLNSKTDRIKPYIIGFFLRPVLTVILFFFGFSLFYGATDFKDFNQVIQSEYVSNPLIALGLIIFIVAVYLYLFLFPFQGPYIRLARRNEFSSNALIWFSYFPVGIFMLMKLDGLFLFFIGVFILNISMFSAGIITGPLLSWFNIGNIFLIIFSFMPIYSIFSSLEKNTNSDSIDNIRGLGRSNIYLGINLTIIFLSPIGFVHHV